MCQVNFLGEERCVLSNARSHNSDGSGTTPFLMACAASALRVFWRRVLHTCHHRTQLTVFLRLLNKPVLSVYGPTSDQTWEGADPTTSVEAAGRK